MKYTKELLLKIVSESISISDVCRKLLHKDNIHGGFHQYISQKIKKYNIDISHFNGMGWNKGMNNPNNNALSKKQFIDTYLIKNSPYIPSDRLKKYCIKFKVLDYKCVVCGNDGVWYDKKITLQIDHINGVRNDNRLINLRILCPNCHSQTETYAGKRNNYGK